jgi:ABC-type antimicrobial peptide transport system permease subunit
VRIALGAGRSDIARMLVGDSLRPVVIGLAAGMVLALWIGRSLQSALYGLSGWDPIAIGASIAFLLLVAATAAWLPARRAARVDPAVELRTQ